MIGCKNLSATVKSSTFHIFTKIYLLTFSCARRADQRQKKTYPHGAAFIWAQTNPGTNEFIEK